MEKILFSTNFLIWISYALFALFVVFHFLGNKDKNLSALVSTVSLGVALFVAQKALNTVERWRVYEVADRCIAWENQTVRLGPGVISTAAVVKNQGGDALAYIDLANALTSTGKDNEFLKMIELQLKRIFGNIEKADNETYIPTTPIEKCGGGGVEAKDDFSPSCVIDQINHDIFWQTRVSVARILRGESARLVFQKNFEKFRPHKMFEELVTLIESDTSLVARREAMKTYEFWACREARDKQSHPCEDFFEGGIYRFEKVASHWRDNGSSVVDSFIKAIAPN